MPLTWSDNLKPAIDAALALEGVTATESVIRDLADKGLYMMARESRARHTSWDYTDLTDYSSLDGSVTIPSDCNRIDYVTWDGGWLGNPMSQQNYKDRVADPTEYSSEAVTNPDNWILKGRTLILIPRVTTIDNLLKIFGYTNFGSLADETNPLTYVPDDFQMLPAYYALWMYPLRDDDVIAAGRRMENETLWKQGLADYLQMEKSLASERFTY